MEFRELGRTGLKVSLIGLGTMTFGVQNTEAEGHAQIDRALDRGVNLLDTAEAYAVSPTAGSYGTTERIAREARAEPRAHGAGVRQSAAIRHQHADWRHHHGTARDQPGEHRRSAIR